MAEVFAPKTSGMWFHLLILHQIARHLRMKTFGDEKRFSLCWRREKSLSVIFSALWFLTNLRRKVEFVNYCLRLKYNELKIDKIAFFPDKNDLGRGGSVFSGHPTRVHPDCFQNQNHWFEGTRKQGNISVSPSLSSLSLYFSLVLCLCLSRSSAQHSSVFWVLFGGWGSQMKMEKPKKTLKVFLIWSTVIRISLFWDPIRLKKIQSHFLSPLCKMACIIQTASLFESR